MRLCKLFPVWPKFTVVCSRDERPGADDCFMAHYLKDALAGMEQGIDNDAYVVTLHWPSSDLALRSPGREKVTVKTKYILMKFMTSSLLWFQNFWIWTRVLEVLVCTVFCRASWKHKVASFGSADFASVEMSAEACRRQASRLWLQAPEWPQDMNF